jgi:hypothetical protein
MRQGKGASSYSLDAPAGAAGMSIAALNWAFRMKIHGAEKSALLALADHANHSGECFPSMGRIAQWAGLTERGAQKAIRALELAGLVSTMRQTGKPSTYFLRVAEVENALPPNVVHPERGSPTPERGSPLPPNHVHPTPERGSPKPPLTIKTTKKEPPNARVRSKRRDYSPEFEAFWTAYPRHAKKPLAFQAFTNALKRAPLEVIMGALKTFPFGTRERFIPHPSSWLNEDRWTEQHDTRDPVLVALGIAPGQDDGNVVQFPLLAGGSNA